jgi:hypothetical protein
VELGICTFRETGLALTDNVLVCATADDPASWDADDFFVIGTALRFERLLYVDTQLE